MSGKIKAFVLTVVTSGARKVLEGVKKDFYLLFYIHLYLNYFNWPGVTLIK